MLYQAACLLALAAPALVAADVFPPPVAAMLAPFPGYNGTLQTGGTVLIGQDNMDTLVLFFQLMGVDPKCVNTSTSPNGCGLHVHSGTTCSATQGHFYDTAISPDPWLPVTYMTIPTTDPMGAMGAGMRIKAGKTLTDVAGKAFVVHDFTGVRVACGVLMAVPFEGDTLIAPTFNKFAAYTGSLMLSGMAGVMQVNQMGMQAQVIAFNFTGADPACVPSALDGVPANGCGIHIHKGTDCSAPGGHYFTAGMMNPWTEVQYTTQMGVAAGVTPPVGTNLPRDNITNHVMVVHDSTGKPYACSQILMTMPSTDTKANFAKATFLSTAVLAFLAAAQLLA